MAEIVVANIIRNYCVCKTFLELKASLHQEFASRIFPTFAPTFKKPNNNDTQRTGNHTQGIPAGAI